MDKNLLNKNYHNTTHLQNNLKFIYSLDFSLIKK